jgi:hypothetical protein
VTRPQSKPHKNVSWKAFEQPGLIAVITSNLLNMIWVTTAFAAVLAVLLGVPNGTTSLGHQWDATSIKIVAEK